MAEKYLLIIVSISLNQLKIPSRCLVNPSIEIEGIAASLIIELRWKIFKSFAYLQVIASFVVCDRDSEGSGLFCEEICIVFNNAQFSSEREEIFRHVFCYEAWVQPVIINLELCSQEVWNNIAYVSSSIL